MDNHEELIRKAVEGSMEKRQALLDRVDNDQDKELREALSSLFDAGANLKARAGGTIEAEFAYKKYSVDELFALIKSREERLVREARLEELVGCYQTVIQLDVPDHTNLVYNPYVEHHNARIAALTKSQEKNND